MPLSRYNKAFGGGQGSAEKAHAAMVKEYGAKKGESVFYATVNKKKPGLVRPSYAEGGIVDKTGSAKVHKGEVVVPADHPARDAIAELLNAAEEGKSPTTAGEEAGYLSRLRRKKKEGQ